MKTFSSLLLLIFYENVFIFSSLWYQTLTWKRLHPCCLIVYENAFLPFLLLLFPFYENAFIFRSAKNVYIEEYLRKTINTYIHKTILDIRLLRRKKQTEMKKSPKSWPFLGENVKKVSENVKKIGKRILFYINLLLLLLQKC